MITKEIVDESLNIHRLVDCGDFDLAYQQSIVFLGKLEKITVKGSLRINAVVPRVIPFTEHHRNKLT